MFQSIKSVSLQLRWTQIKQFMNDHEPSWTIMNLNECHKFQWMSRISVNHHELSWNVNWESSRLSGTVTNHHEFSLIFKNFYELSYISINCQESSGIVINCHEISWIVMNYHWRSWIILHCPELSRMVMNCQKLAWIVIKCHV